MAMVSIVYKDDLKKFQTDTADEDFFHWLVHNDSDWLREQAQEELDFILLNPANSWSAANVFYDPPKL